MAHSTLHEQSDMSEEPSTNRSLVWLARFMTEDLDNQVFRRFDELRILQILSIQHEIIHCSESLSLLRQSGQNKGLAGILAQLRILLPEYDNAILACKRMQEFDATPDYVRKVLEAKARERVEPSLALEYDREDGWGDLISIAGVSKGPLHGFIDSKLQLQNVFRKKEQNFDVMPLESGLGTDYRSVSKKGFFYYSERAVRLTEQCVIYIVVFCLLITPILALPFTETEAGKLGLIIACVVLAFLASLLLLERSPVLNFKLLLGYAAILVTFLNNSGGN